MLKQVMEKWWEARDASRLIPGLKVPLLYALMVPAVFVLMLMLAQLHLLVAAGFAAALVAVFLLYHGINFAGRWWHHRQVEKRRRTATVVFRLE